MFCLHLKKKKKGKDGGQDGKKGKEETVLWYDTGT